MRLLVACGLLVALLVPLPLAAPQVVPSPQLTTKLAIQSEAVSPGDLTLAKVTLTRVCPSSAMVLDPQDVQATFTGSVNASIPGPVHFKQQVCATQIMQDQELDVDLRVLADAPRGMLLNVTALFHTLDSSPTTSAMPDLRVPFTLQTSPAPPTPPAATPPPQEAPALSSVLLAMALACLAGLRRRS